MRQKCEVDRAFLSHRKCARYENRVNVVQRGLHLLYYSLWDSGSSVTVFIGSVFWQYPDRYSATDGKTLCEPSLTKLKLVKYTQLNKA